jgi:hypothetical protein
LGLRERLILVNNNNQERFLLLNGSLVEGSGVAASQKMKSGGIAIQSIEYLLYCDRLNK